MLPGANGLEVCRALRPRYRGAILMLTASQSEADHVAGLEFGADDFVNKPIEPRVLLARIRAQLRRLGKDHARRDQRRVELGPLSIDLDAREVRIDERRVPFTTMEFEVVAMLARDLGTVVKRDDLYQQVMGQEYDGIDRGMDVHVSRIRRKLKRCGFDPHRVKSVRGVGYILTQR